MEILVVIGLAAVVAVAGYVTSIGAFQRNTFSTERDLAVSLLQRARSQALANINQSAHGVVVESDKFVVYEDTNESGDFNAGDSSFDVPRSASVMASGDAEFLFDQLSGNGILTGSLRLTGQRTNVDEAIITVEDNGRINWVWN